MRPIRREADEAPQPVHRSQHALSSLVEEQTVVSGPTQRHMLRRVRRIEPPPDGVTRASTPDI